MGRRLTDENFMSQALRLGQRVLGQTDPNPAVGCVIMRDGRIMARAQTHPGGRPHAETQALAIAGADARGATAYVTLEPCAHTGKTGPCAQALIDAGIARVVIGCQDPDPRVAGRGVAMLRDAGVEVELGVCGDAAQTLHAAFFHRIATGRPEVTLKLALSADGRIATKTGDSQWITGPIARRHVHAARARHGAIMVGAGTVRADDPKLTVRDMGDVSQPIRVVVSRDCDFDAPHLLGSLDQSPLWFVHSAAPKRPSRFTDLPRDGFKMIKVSGDDQGVDPSAVLQALGDEGINSVYCEGGGTLAASLLRAGLVDHLHIYSAGVLIGAEGRAGIGDLGLRKLADATRFQLVRSQPMGGDVFQHWARQ